MTSTDGEHFTNRNQNTCVVSKTVISRVFKYVKRLNYKHFTQFPSPLENLTVTDFTMILRDAVSDIYFRPNLKIER